MNKYNSFRGGKKWYLCQLNVQVWIIVALST